MTEPWIEGPSDWLMNDDPGIYQDLLAERDEAMQKHEQACSENRRLREWLKRIAQSGNVSAGWLRDDAALALSEGHVWPT